MTKKAYFLIPASDVAVSLKIHRISLTILISWLVFAGAALCQEVSDSLRPTDAAVTDSTNSRPLFIIPCGDQIGSFTPSARVAVADTVAGWAKIFVEGWVPVEQAIPFMARPQLIPGLSSVLDTTALKAKQKAERPQCVALTRKGARCTRRAEKGSDRCWQHQLR